MLKFTFLGLVSLALSVSQNSPFHTTVGSPLLLLAISEIIPGLAGTLEDCRMSWFICHVLEKPL